MTLTSGKSMSPSIAAALTEALACERGADFSDGFVEPAFDFVGDAGDGARFVFQFGDAGQQLLALVLQAVDLGSVRKRPRFRLGEGERKALQPVERGRQLGCHLI